MSALLAPPGFGATPVPTVTATPAPTVPSSPVTVTGTPVPTVSTALGTPTSPGSSTSCYTYPSVTTGPGGVVASYDFENGTTQNWAGTGGATVTNTDQAAASGTRSLRVEGLTTANNVGVSLGALPHFGWYQVSVKVRVVSPQPASQVILRVANVPDSIAGAAVAGENGWSTVTAYFRPSTLYADWYCNGSMTGTQVPYGGSVRLSLDVMACGQYIDRPATVFVDDAQVTSYWASPSATPASTVRPTVAPPTSPNCGTVTPTTTSPTIPTTCQVKYTHQSQWATGYVASVEIKNLTGSTAQNWTLAWTFPDDQKINSMWGATYTQNGRAVTATAMSWGPIPGMGTVTIGFLGSSQGTAGIPASFALNGMTCL